MMYLLSRKHEVTPDLFHFVTCMHEDYQHMLWLVFLWLCFRQPDSPQALSTACIELALSHFACGCISNFLFQAAISCVFFFVFRERKLVLCLFLSIYLTLNFWVNLVDFFCTGLIYDYYHDDFFTTSLSNKVH